MPRDRNCIPEAQPSLPLAVFAFFLVLLPLPRCVAQGVAEAAGATSVSSGVTINLSKIPVVLPPQPSASSGATSNGGKSPHLPASAKTPSSEENRRALELHAGPDAGKVLLRTKPTAAQVWVNGALVGDTPLLLVLGPGKYSVEFRGQRQEFATRVLDLLPKETREVTVDLVPRYPSRVTVR